MRATKYLVTAQSFSRATGRPTAAPRRELIDAWTNELFYGAATVLDVKERYEAFWNHLNPRSADVVFVLRVAPQPNAKS